MRILFFLLVINLGFSQTQVFHFLNPKGEKVFSFEANEIIDFKFGTVLVKKDNQYALLGENGAIEDKISLEKAKEKLASFVKLPKNFKILKGNTAELNAEKLNWLQYNLERGVNSAYKFVPSIENQAKYNTELAQYNKLVKAKNIGETRLKNASVFDQGLLYSKARIALLYNFHSEYQTQIQAILDFVKDSEILKQNESINTTLWPLYEAIGKSMNNQELLATTLPYEDPNTLPDVDPRKLKPRIREEADLAAIKAQVEYEKNEAEILKPEFDAIVTQCGSKSCYRCNGTGKEKKWAGMTTVTSREEVWSPSTAVVNTSTGNVSYQDYGFKSQTVSRQEARYVDATCYRCSGQGKCFKYECIDTIKYKKVIAKYYPNICYD